jgi:hypothetical protein
MTLRRHDHGTKRRSGALSALFAAVALAGGVLVVATEPAGASSPQLYAYANGAATAPTSCPKESSPADRCSLTEALGLVQAGGTVVLATPPGSGRYYGDFAVSTPDTSASNPVTIAPASAVKSPILDGDASKAVPCPTASCAGSVLSVSSGVDVELQSFTIEDASSSGNGGAVDDAGAASLAEMTISDCTAADGGAVYVENGATLSVSQSVFDDDSGYVGGAIANAIYLNSGTVTVTTSSFVGDAAGDDGGAIDNGDSLNLADATAPGFGSLTVSSTTFKSDTAGNDGGAIDSSDNWGDGSLTVATSKFKENKAGADGGAIDSGDNNSAESLSIASTSFVDDTAGTDGGAIDSSGGGSGGSLAVSGSTFKHDKAGVDGGGIDNGDNAGSGLVSSLSVSVSSFSENSADRDGGAIDNADDLIPASGGGIGSLTIEDSSVYENSAGVNGGAIDSADNAGTGSAAIDESTLYDNTAGSNGGAIDNGDDAGSGSVTALNSTVDDNGGTQAVDNAGGSVLVAASILSGSSGTNCSGAITDGGYNLENDSGASCGFSASHNDVVGKSPELAPLTFGANGTAGLKPNLTSPARDALPYGATSTAGGNSYELCPVLDQRGAGAPPAPYGCAIGSIDVYDAQLPVITKLSETSGSPGDVLVVTGANFSSVTSVHFGSVKASYKVESSQKISVTVPPGSGTVPVTVTTAGGAHGSHLVTPVFDASFSY